MSVAPDLKPGIVSPILVLLVLVLVKEVADRVVDRP